MSNENQNTTNTSASSNQSANANTGDNSQDALKKIWEFINQPAIASAGLGAYLHWVIDPKGMKRTLQSIEEQMEQLMRLNKDQRDQLDELERRIVKLTKRLDDKTEDDERRDAGAKGNRNSLNGAYLD